MKVSKLIALLQTLPQNARVVVSGYEDGYDDVGGAEPVRINLNANTEWYYGRHELAFHDQKADCTAYILRPKKRKD